MGEKFKILSIDGGGIRGIIPAKILCELEEDVHSDSKQSLTNIAISNMTSLSNSTKRL